MRKLCLLVFLSLVPMSAAAGPIGGGDACVTIADEAGPLFRDCVAVSSSDGSFQYALGETLLGGVEGFRIDGLTFSGDTDPFIAYSISVTDLGLPSSLSFTFFTPIVPDAYTHATSALSVQLQGALALIEPVSPATTMQSGSAGTPSPGTNLGVDVGLACGPGSVLCTYTAENFFAPTIYDGLTATVAFQLSGGGDRALLNGLLVIDKQTIPEPALTLLLGTALAGVVARRRRRE